MKPDISRKKLTDVYPFATMGAKGPNHFGLEKWKKTMFNAAKQRRPLSAGRRSFLIFARDWVSASLRGLSITAETSLGKIWAGALRKSPGSRHARPSPRGEYCPAHSY